MASFGFLCVFVLTGLWPTNCCCQSSSSWSWAFWELWCTWSSSVNKWLGGQKGSAQKPKTLHYLCHVLLFLFTMLICWCQETPCQSPMSELLLSSRELLSYSSKKRSRCRALMVCNYTQSKAMILWARWTKFPSVIIDWRPFLYRLGLLVSLATLENWATGSEALGDELWDTPKRARGLGSQWPRLLISEPLVWVHFLCLCCSPSPLPFTKGWSHSSPLLCGGVEGAHKNTWQLYILTETEINHAIINVYVMHNIMYWNRFVNFNDFYKAKSYCWVLSWILNKALNVSCGTHGAFSKNTCDASLALQVWWEKISD